MGKRSAMKVSEFVNLMTKLKLRRFDHDDSYKKGHCGNCEATQERNFCVTRKHTNWQAFQPEELKRFKEALKMFPSQIKESEWILYKVERFWIDVHTTCQNKENRSP